MSGTKSKRLFHVVEVICKRVKEGNTYYTAVEGVVLRAKDVRSSFNDYCFNAGLYWSTAKEAGAFLDRDDRIGWLTP